MRCPWCGHPEVMIRNMRIGRQWECPWCGDNGWLKSPPVVPQDRPAKVERPAKIVASVSLVDHVDLSESWITLKDALAALAPSQQDALRPLLAKTLLYEISAGIRQRSAPPAMRKMQKLEAFLQNTPDLLLDERTDVLMRRIRRKILYAQEGELSRQVCGSFWLGTLCALRTGAYHCGKPNGIDELVGTLACAYGAFGGESAEGAEAAQKRRKMLLDTFQYHWQEKVYRRAESAND